MPKPTRSEAEGMLCGALANLCDFVAAIAIANGMPTELVIERIEPIKEVLEAFPRGADKKSVPSEEVIPAS